jgi:RHS repeat-associated protein
VRCADTGAALFNAPRFVTCAPASGVRTDRATNRLVAPGIEYDAAGNMTRDAVTGSGLRTYDGENRLTAAQGAGGTWFRYVYDADGKRVKRNVGTASETWMVYGFDGELVAEYAAPNGVNPQPSAPTTEYAYRAGEMLIQADASDCKWLVSDHLGSPRIILGKSGSLADTKRRDFMPFGEDLGAGQFGRTTALGYEPSGTPSNPREKFATYERDDETGLDFAQARYYQSRLGRFTSVDPVLLTEERLVDPQRINLYAYVRNSPLSHTDPVGKDILVIENGPTKGNPVGHTAIAITGYGVFSFGNGTKLGSSATDYLLREAGKRNTTVYVIKTTAEQDQAALEAILNEDEKGVLGIYPDNCAGRSNCALDAAGIPQDVRYTIVPSIGSLGIIVFKIVRTQSDASLPGTAGKRAQRLPADKVKSIKIPMGSESVPNELEQFNPVAPGCIPGGPKLPRPENRTPTNPTRPSSSSSYEAFPWNLNSSGH